jgi:hypothetical protein
MRVEQTRMSIAYVNGQLRALAAGALLSSLSLGGCMTSTAGSSPMDAQDEAPAPPKTSAYPSIEPKRERPTITADAQLKLQKELIAARDRQAAAAKAQGNAARAEPVKP